MNVFWLLPETEVTSVQSCSNEEMRKSMITIEILQDLQPNGVEVRKDEEVAVADVRYLVVGQVLELAVRLCNQCLPKSECPSQACCVAS